MQKSENKIKPIYWGWDGIYEYCQLRQYYKSQYKDLEQGPVAQSAEATDLKSVKYEFESHGD